MISAAQSIHAFIRLNDVEHTVHAYHITEAISRAWRGYVDILVSKPMNVQDTVGQTVILRCCDSRGFEREWIGLMIACDACRGREYRLSIASRVYTLKHQHIAFRTYCGQDARHITEEVLRTGDLWSSAQAWFIEKRMRIYPMAVQVNESLYDFMARQLAQEDIVWLNHTVDGLDRITFLDNANPMRDWPMLEMKALSLEAIERQGRTALGYAHWSAGCRLAYLERDLMPTVKDWEDLPKERLYRGVPSMGVGNTVPGLWIRSYVPMDYDIYRTQEGLRARENALSEAYQVYTFVSMRGNDARLSLMHLVQHDAHQYRVNHVEHHAQREGAALRYYHEAMLVPLGEIWRGVCPPWPVLPPMMQGIVESRSDTPALDDQCRIFVKMLADTRELEPCTATVGIPCMTPYAQSGGGMSFPLHPGAEVAVGFLYNEPDLPVILGAMYNVNNQNPVTDQNPLQTILRTASGNTLLMDDDPQQPMLSLVSQGQKLEMRSGASPMIRMRCVGGVIFQSQGHMHWKAGKNLVSIIGGMYTQCARQSQKFETKNGNIDIHAAQDLDIVVQHTMTLSVKKDAEEVVGGGTRLRIGEGTCITIGEGDMRCTVKGATYMDTVDGISLYAKTGTVSIMAADGKAGIRLTDDGTVTLFGECVIFDCDKIEMAGEIQYGMKPTRVERPFTPILNTFQSIPLKRWSGLTVDPVLWFEPKVKLQYPNRNLSYYPLRHSVEYQYATKGKTGSVWGVKLHVERMGEPQFLKRVVEGQITHIRFWSTETTQLICADTGQPLAYQEYDVQDMNDKTVLEILCLPPPVIIDVREERDGFNRHSRNQLTREELQYFKENGNNATIFIHGFNVEFGNYGTYQKMCLWLKKHRDPRLIKDNIASTSSAPFTVRHDYHEAITREELENLFKDKVLGKKIRDDQVSSSEYTSDQKDRISEQQDDHKKRGIIVNPVIGKFYGIGAGEGTHGWFVNMEYNFNAVSGFQGDYRDSKYSRIINVAWSGDVPLPYYLAAEHFADLAAARLIHLIRQLVAAGVKIHIVSHSLGSRVLLMLLHELGADPAYRECIDSVFMWQAAVPDTAIIDMKGIDTSIKQNWKTYHAIYAVKNMNILYSENDLETLQFSYEMAATIGISPACFVKENDKHCTPDDKKALNSHHDYKLRNYILPRLHVRPPLGLKGEKGYDDGFENIAKAFKNNHMRKLRFIDYSAMSDGHSYMKVKDYVEGFDVYQKAIENSMYQLGLY